jgi:hypothetical protein
MICPDDARLDLWLDGALAPADERTVAAHVAGCATCAGRRATRVAEEALWRAALALDASELAALAGADLTAWRRAAAPARSARWWPALLLLGAAATYAAWLLAAPALEAAAELAGRLGLVGMGLGWALARLWDAAAALVAAAAHVSASNTLLWAAAAALALWLFVAQPWSAARADS